MATMPDQFQGAFQAIAINMIEFSSSLDPAQDMSGLSAQQFSFARSDTYMPKRRFIYTTDILGK